MMDSGVLAPLVWGGGIAFALCAAAMPALRAWALARGSVVETRPDRWHREATPAVGGIGIFAASCAGLIVALVLLGAAPGVGGGPERALVGVIAGGFLMFCAGVWDDARDLAPSTKLVTQLLASALVVSGGAYLLHTGVFLVDVLVSMAWLVALTNALNLLDNMNGLAAGVAAIAAGYLGVIHAWDGSWTHAAFAFSLAGASLGFLIHNYPKAGIFMGDGGSLFLGLSLAALAFPAQGVASPGLLPALAIPVLVLAVPILDTLLVTASRLAEGRPLSQGGRDHTSHRLVAVGIAERRAVRLLWLFAGLSGAVALGFKTGRPSVGLLLSGVVLLILATVAVHLLGVQVRERVGARTLLAKILAAHRHWPALALALDAVAVATAYYGAYLLRWDGADLERELVYFRQTLPLVIGLKIVAMRMFRVYGSPLKHLSVEDGERLILANVTGSGASFLGAVMLLDYGFSRGILVVDFLLAVALTVGYRLFVPVLDRQGRSLREGGEPCVVLGSEADAVLLLNELHASGISAFRPVCILDPGGYGRGHLRGVTVQGGSARARTWLSRNAVSGAFVVRRDGCLDPDLASLVETCLEGGVPVHFLDVSLALNGAPGTITVGRPTAPAKPPERRCLPGVG
ncbi:MAG: hypothetical protein HKO53_00110 [Gemmatimonadetes bacterium]|nr:hypothetical protein [Gemmatimonadota bacterium]